MYEFIELFAPHLTRRVIEAACERHGTGALDELFADMELPTY
jgi:LysR family cys regulon transcriptional activator